jgi:hypothetical protein
MDAQEMQEAFAQRASYDNIKSGAHEMSPKQRFEAIMSYQPFDRIIDTEFGYWNQTLQRWHEEGLPREIDSELKANAFFGFDKWVKNVPVNASIQPYFKEKIIARNARHTIKTDGRGITCKVFTDGADSIPHFLDFPIKDHQTYIPFKKRLAPLLDQRIKVDLSDIAEKTRNRNYILAVLSGSTAGYIRDLMGFEGFATAIYLQPGLIEEILDDFKRMYCALAHALSSKLSIDCVVWWEDIAFKTGPIAPPDFFYAKCGPVYKAVMDIYRTKGGAMHSWVDCDGDNRLLVPTWLDNGVDIIFPLEVNAGVHPEALRKKHDAVRMMGGFDKTVLLAGNDAIKKELRRLKPLVAEGGFIPHVDHRVQADVPYQTYLYYLETKRELFNIPNSVIS